MKWILTDNNILYDNSYSNILYFGTNEKRDQYVNNYLLDNYLEKLSQRPNINQQLLGVVENVINIGITREELDRKNYIIIEDNLGNISFHFINGYENDGNNNSFTLSIEKDLNMTYPTIWDNIKNIFAEQTHLNNYFGYEIDGGHKEVINIQDLPYSDLNEVYNQLANKGWLIVFERVNNINDYLQKSTNGKIYKEPFRVYIAPLKPFTTTENGTSEVILFDQPDPIKIPILSRDGFSEKKFQNIGLYSNVSLDQDLSITISYVGEVSSSFDVNEKKITIRKEILQQFQYRDEINIMFANNGDDESAELATRQAIEVDYPITFEEILDEWRPGSGGTLATKVWYFPLKIVKTNTNSFRFEILQISDMNNEWNELRYNYQDGNRDITVLYEFYENQNAYGLVSPSNNTAEDGVIGSIKIHKISQFQSNTWSVDNLLTYLENPDDTIIIGSRTTNFIPIDTDQESGVFTILQSNNIRYDEDKKIYYINFLNYDKLLEINKHTINFSDYSKYDLIEGLNKYSFGIENLKEFDLNANYINKETKQMIFEHYASFTPDWEERLKFIDSSYLNLTNDENSFINSKEFIKGNDLLSQYKVNNPVKSKFDWLRPIFSLGNVASLFLGKERAARRIGKTVTTQKFGRVGTESILGPRGGTTYKPKYGKRTTKTTTNYDEIGGGNNGTRNLLRALPLLGGIAQVPVNRANMRKAPDQFQGNGDINGDLIFNFNSINFSLYQYEFINPSRKAIIRDLKMHGINDQIFLESLWDYKQTSFNFYKLGDIDISNSQTLRNILKPEEYDKVNEIIMDGFTLWYNVESYLDWESNEEMWE